MKPRCVYLLSVIHLGWWEHSNHTLVWIKQLTWARLVWLQWESFSTLNRPNYRKQTCVTGRVFWGVSLKQTCKAQTAPSSSAGVLKRSVLWMNKKESKRWVWYLWTYLFIIISVYWEDVMRWSGPTLATASSPLCCLATTVTAVIAIYSATL